MKVMVIAPHPDDETLGCGGTLLRHLKNGDELYWVIITKVDPNLGWDEDFVKKRESEIDQVGIKYNFKKPISGRGSCIFIHLTKDYKPTAGCVALREKDFLIMLKLIRKNSKIKII